MSKIEGLGKFWVEGMCLGLCVVDEQDYVELD